MQKNNIKKALFLTVISSIIFIILRIVFLFKNYDSESGFFLYKTPVTLFYIGLLIICGVLYLSKKRYAIKTNYEIKKSWGLIVLNSILAAAFIVILFKLLNDKNEYTALESVVHSISIFSAAFSALYHIISSLTREKFVAILNVAPVLYFVSLTIIEFIDQTGHANTYNDFSLILALIATAFLVLEEGKADTISDNSILFPTYFISLILLSQSVIPDLINLKLTLNGILLTLYFIVLVIKTVLLIHSCEDK